MNSTEVLGGTAFIVIGTALMFATTTGMEIPLAASAVGAVGLSIGTLLVGTSKSSQV